MSNLKNLLLAASLFAPSLLASCAAPIEGDDDCSEGKCDDVPDSEVPASPCDGKIEDVSGANHSKVIGRNNDPLAKLAFMGEGCPTSFEDIMAKLRQTDKEGCAGEKDGISTRLVSETAQASGQAGGFRSVTTRRCNGRGTEGIVFSLFGLSASALPGSVEMISFDETAGVFNFYDSDGDKMKFFGSSKDMLKGAGGGDIRRCANCHTGGGLVMKELDTPWMHWEGHENSPGSQQIIDAHKDLGTKATGAEFEGVVKAGNAKWNKTRLAHFKGEAADPVQDLLKPLFCTVEFNIDNGADFGSPVSGAAGGSQISGVPFDSLLDPQLKGFGSLSVTFADYDAVIRANGQKLQGVSGAIDTFFDYAFIERSHADNDHINQLKAAGIVDDDLIKDVLMVDFTRHVFSSDRCGLLAFAPKLTGEDLTAAKIRDGFIANLEAETPVAGSPAAVLLDNLKAANDAAAHTTKIDAFTNACKALGSKPFLQNALKITSLNRTLAKERPVMEFPATVPTDNQNVDPDSRLDPKTCQVVTSFVAP